MHVKYLVGHNTGASQQNTGFIRNEALCENGGD